MHNTPKATAILLNVLLKISHELLEHFYHLRTPAALSPDPPRPPHDGPLTTQTSKMVSLGYFEIEKASILTTFKNKFFLPPPGHAPRSGQPLQIGSALIITHDLLLIIFMIFIIINNIATFTCFFFGL